MTQKPYVLCILDGWGSRSESQQNSIALAATPHWNRFLKTYPHSEIQTSGHAVGLPEGQIGNSEVGHTCIGSGRVVWQDLPRIDQAIQDGSLAQNPLLLSFIETLKKTGGRCHLLGLLSPGGVHSHQDHLWALSSLLSAHGIAVAFHAFLDGRDTPPTSGLDYLETFLNRLKSLKNVSLATIGGRYFAMDRDQRWDRVQKAYDVMVSGESPQVSDPLTELQAFYEQGIQDEFIPPFALEGYGGIQEGDGLLMGNFRADRARQILTALLDPSFVGFKRGHIPHFSAARGLRTYSDGLTPLIPPLFPDIQVNHTLGELIAQKGWRQLRIAETEKYAHVTFFFNGGREEPFPGEDRILIPSPKVATYDLKPEMSAFELTDRLIEALHSQRYEFIVVNYANPDMVGHTGNLEASIQAIQVVDACLGRLEKAVLEKHGTLLITADHGNVEMMEDPLTGKIHTAHTLCPVPCLLICENPKLFRLKNGTLADIAPTLIELIGLEKPQEMTGQSLLEKDCVSGALRV